MENEEIVGNSYPKNTYAEGHSQFVTSDQGTSPVEILHILISVSLTPLLASLLIPWVVPPKFIPMAFGDRCSRDFIRALIEYPVVIVLPLLLVTVFAGDSSEESEAGFYQHLSYCMPTVLFLTCCGIVIVNHSITQPSWKSISVQWSRFQNKIISLSIGRISKHSKKQVKLPFFTTYRSLVIYLTVVSILAIDFNIFPRRFAKTKTFGFSLMDVGTGSFVFANGIVSSEAKRLTSNFRHTIISTIPLFFLGFVRLLTVKGLEYQEVVEEYGVHWNFFFTLAFVKIFTAILFKILSPKHALKIGFLIGITYDCVLVLSGFQNDYILNHNISREVNLINANREGIFSAVGYTSIYMLSVYCGQVIYQNKRPLARVRDWFHYAMVSGTQITFLWILTYFTHIYWNPSSRRVGNFTYVLWAVATNYSVLWLNLMFYLLQTFLQHTGLIYGPLLFYQLETYDKESKIRKMKQELEKNKIQDEAKWRLEQDELLHAQTDFELSHLEKKVSQIEKKMKMDNKEEELSQKELEALTKEAEEDLLNIRKSCLKKSDLLDVVKNVTSGSSKHNLAYLPDLTLTPITLEAISFNGLAVFLLGNLLTGAVNSIIASMYTPSAIAILILWVYCSFITIVFLLLYFYQIQLKFW